MSGYVFRSIILIAWVGSMFAAFQFGRKLPSPVSDDEIAQNPGQAVTFNPSGKSGGNFSQSKGSSGKAEIADKKNEYDEAIVSVPELIASMKSRFGTMGGMMFNASSMMKIMAPIADLSEAQIHEALEEVGKTVSVPHQKMMFYQLLLGRLAEVDGEGAMEFISENLSDQTGFSASMSVSVIGTWAQRDPDAAWNWFVNLRAEQAFGQINDSSISFMFSGLAAQDLGNAFRRLDELEEFERNMGVTGIAMSVAWNPDSRDELLSRAKVLPSGRKNQIYQRLFSQWAMTTPQDAIEWARQLPEEDRKKIAKQGGDSVLHFSPEIGAEFMLENASEEELPRTYSMIVGQWATSDPNAAGAWLNDLPQGPYLDQARSSFARTISPRDPLSAMEWAKAVEEGKQRTQAIRQVYSQWYQKSPQEADGALDSSGLSAEEVAAMRQAVAKIKVK